MPAPSITILEDDPERTSAFRAALAPWALDLVIVDNAPDMIEWLGKDLSRTALICLDHDLGPSRLRAEARFEPGSGRDVADWLAGRPAHCPVLVHSANGLAVPGMLLVLESAGWIAQRVVPTGDLDWIRESWLPAVVGLLGAPGPAPTDTGA